MNLKKSFPKKRFGQHWLINEKILETIKKSADLKNNDFLLEIGPGKGALTSRLLDSNIRGLYAVELDNDLIDLLTEKFSKNKNFYLRQGDILSIDLDDVGYDFTKLIANIPYNITGPILKMFLGGLGELPKYKFERIIFLMQKDIVDRIIAKDGDRNVGALGTRINLISKVIKICDIPPNAFYPPPKVYSSLVVFQPFKSNERLDIKIEQSIENLLKIAFNARRKKLKNTLCSILSLEDMEYLKTNSEISFDLRPQDLSIDKWIEMAKFCIKINH